MQGQAGFAIFCFFSLQKAAFRRFGLEPWRIELSKRLTISECAKAAGIPTTTLRYYERIRLVEPEDRSFGNYRLYGDHSLNKLKFIKAAQAIGFTLEDVKSLLADGEGNPPTCDSVQGLIESRLTDVEECLKDLRHVRKVLKSALEQCHRQKNSDCCQVVADLRNKK